jgi:hypothetical protein
MRPATKRGAKASHVEQRAETRHVVQGEVRFTFDEGGSAKGGSKEIRGKLLDRSTSGFRAEHDCPGLTSGQVVRFRITASSHGTARVVWTRILGERVETGFLIL